MNADTDNTEHSSAAPHRELRFVHTADLHLDSPLRSLALRDPTLASLVETATRTALIRIVDLCIDEAVDALLIAGDLYDADQKSMHTAALLINQMRRLHKAGIPVFIIRGNHDSLAAITARLSLPDNVHVFSTRGESVELAGTSAVIHGVSFGKKHIPESLLPRFPAPKQNAINIGMLHTSLNGSAQHDVYAPCSLRELEDFGYHYWALGHIHKRSEQGSSAKIVMPGIPQGRDVSETGPGTASLVTIDEEQTIQIEAHVVGPAQFEPLEIDLSYCTDWNAMVNLIQDNLSSARRHSTADHLIVRVILIGSTELHFKLTRDYELLLEVVREHCMQSGDTWIDKLQNKTSNTLESANTPVAHEALPDLTDIIQNSVLGSPNIQKLADKEIEQFVSKLPTDIKHLFGETAKQRRAITDHLMEDGSLNLLQKISLGDDS